MATKAKTSRRTANQAQSVGAATVKRSISLPRELDRAIAEHVGPGEFSAFAADALTRAIQAAGVRSWIAEATMESGPLTAVERASAKRRWRR
ncbi:MAG TPA: hypothetical protein VGD50_07820 [Candidatus Baltobacteraceae bacterium]